MTTTKVLQFPKPRRQAHDHALDRMIVAHQRKHTARLSMMGIRPCDLAARLLNRTTNHF